MKKLLVAATLAGSVFTYSALAESEHSISANVGVFTNYVWRGQTQTDDGPALQGGVDYGHSSGAYAGIWASNIYDAAEDGQALEYDLYGGFAGEAGDIGYDVGMISYHLTIEDSDPVQEFYFGGSFQNFGLMYYYGITSDENDGDGYLALSADFDLDVVALALHAGNSMPDEGDSESDIAVTVSKDDFSFAPGHEFGLSVTKTSYEDGDGSEDPKALVYWTTSFDL